LADFNTSKLKLATPDAFITLRLRAGITLDMARHDTKWQEAQAKPRKYPTLGSLGMPLGCFRQEIFSWIGDMTKIKFWEQC